MFENLKTDRMLNDGPGLHAGLAKLENTRKKPCHNRDTKSFFSTKTNLIDKMRWLILRNILKAKDSPKIRAYLCRWKWSAGSNRTNADAQ